jgi:hypothetical protein
LIEIKPQSAQKRNEGHSERQYDLIVKIRDKRIHTGTCEDASCNTTQELQKPGERPATAPSPIPQEETWAC